MMKFSRRFAAVFLFTLAFSALHAASAHAQQFSAAAVEADVTIQGDTAQATFKIQVSSQADEAMTNCWVVFEDGTTASIGDLPARGTAVSETQNRIVPVTIPESGSVPLKVTVKFTQGDVTVELPWVINLSAK